MKRRPLQPITEYETAIWKVWDRLQAALMSDLSRWSKAANKAFLDLLRLDRRAYEKSPSAYNAAYGFWLTARGHDSEVREAEAELLARIEEQHEWFKAKLKQQKKDHLKAYRAQQRAVDKAARKEKKDAVVRTTSK